MIRFYSTQWCGDCLMAKKLLEDKGVSFDEIDIDKNAEGAEFVRATNRGMRSVPTIVFPDGATMTEPSYTELSTKLKELGF